MSFQLIFTSAPRGLTLGRSGFCTVARHREISDSLVSFLERCSAYERQGEPGTEQPVIHSYRIVRLGSSIFHVLTRIQDSGVDYTQRGNHLAQHLIFLPAELAESPTPADIFLNWNGWLDAWSGAPRYLGPEEQPRLASIPKSTSLPARTWQEQTGDAAHAVLLVQPDWRQGALLTASSLSSVQALNLLGESLLLLESEQSGTPGPWSIPFTTHLQSHEQAEDFYWRCEETADPSTLSSRPEIPVLSLEASTWPKVTDASLAQLAREGKNSAPAPEAAALPERPLPKTDSQPIPRAPLRKPPFSSPNSPPSGSRKNSGIFGWAATVLVLLVLGGAYGLTRSTAPSPSSSFTTELASLQAPGQREALRQFLREHPAASLASADQAALARASLWLEASDCLESLQFLRRQEQGPQLEESLTRILNLPQLPDLKQALPQLGYEIAEAQAWLARQATPPPATTQLPSPVPEPRPLPPAFDSVSLVHFFGSHPVILTTLSPENNLVLSQIPEAADWMDQADKSSGRIIRVLPLNTLPLSGEGASAKSQPRRNRSDPLRFYQGVHLLFESKELDEIDGARSFEISFAKDFSSMIPSGTFGRVLQFEDATGVLFSVCILKPGTSEPLLRVPAALTLEQDSSSQRERLRNEFYRQAKITLAAPATAALISAAGDPLSSPGISLDGSAWEKLTGPETASGPLRLHLHFPGEEEGKTGFNLFQFETESSP